jgi:perosamine synthetase
MTNTLALLGGTPLRTQPFAHQQTIGDEEKRAVMEVMDSGVLSKFLGEYDPDFYGGPRVKKIEAEFAARFSARHAIATNSATTALQVSVAACQLGPGDEVIVSPYTMSASATAILMQNAIPVFADVQADNFCLDPHSIREHLTPQTRGILVVHIFGQPADMQPILDLARERNLRLIEDAAQSVGATYQGRYTGTFGDAGILSLNYHKIIHTGEGGIVLTNNDIVAERARLVRNHGECVVEELGWSDVAHTLGSNYRMTEIEAAIGVEQLHKLDGLFAHRNRLAAHLTQRLAALDDLITPPVVHPAASHAFYVYAVKFHAERAGLSRHTFAQALKAEGVPFGEGYVRPLYLQPLYQQRIAYGREGCPWTCGHYHGQVSYAKGLCPTAERLHEHELLIADICHTPLTPGDMDDVANAFEKVLEHRLELRDWEHRQTPEENTDRGSGRWRR